MCVYPVNLVEIITLHLFKLVTSCRGLCKPWNLQGLIDIPKSPHYIAHWEGSSTMASPISNKRQKTL